MIKRFQEFINENEEPLKNIEYPKRASISIIKKFFKELKRHIEYWFKYDMLKKYNVENIEDEKRSVLIWFNDDKYQYKVKYTETDPKDDIEKVADVILVIRIYNHDTQELVSEMEERQPMKYVTAKSLNRTLESSKKRIVKTPKSEEDIEDFKSKETRHLSDNKY